MLSVMRVKLTPNGYGMLVLLLTLVILVFCMASFKWVESLHQEELRSLRLQGSCAFVLGQLMSKKNVLVQRQNSKGWIVSQCLNVGKM